MGIIWGDYIDRETTAGQSRPTLLQLGMTRIDSRGASDLRPVKISLGQNNYAEGSALVEFGNTKVLCTASLETSIPKWLQGTDRGWVSAEYGMLPRSTHDRMRRDKTATSGRTQEISRLVARALRSCVDLYALKDKQITVDCDVLQADGGTRTAAITGGFVALAQAACYMQNKKMLTTFPIKNFISAISVGITDNDVLLDLCYEEDSNADTDTNFVINDRNGIVEIQGTAEDKDFSREQLGEMLDMAFAGCSRLHEEQKKVLEPLGILGFMGR